MVKMPHLSTISEIKCQLTLPPLRGTTYEPAYRSLFSPGEKIRVTCGEAYWILNTQTTFAETTCKNDGDWTIRPVCEGIKLHLLYTHISRLRFLALQRFIYT